MSSVVTLNATIRPDQDALLIAYARNTGKISKSAALREILDDWLKMQRLIESPRPENSKPTDYDAQIPHEGEKVPTRAQQAPHQNAGRE